MLVSAHGEELGEECEKQQTLPLLSPLAKFSDSKSNERPRGDSLDMSNLFDPCSPLKEYGSALSGGHLLPSPIAEPPRDGIGENSFLPFDLDGENSLRFTGNESKGSSTFKVLEHVGSAQFPLDNVFANSKITVEAKSPMPSFISYAQTPATAVGMRKPPAFSSNDEEIFSPFDSIVPDDVKCFSETVVPLSSPPKALTEWRKEDFEIFDRALLRKRNVEQLSDYHEFVAAMMVEVEGRLALEAVCTFFKEEHSRMLQLLKSDPDCISLSQHWYDQIIALRCFRATRAMKEWENLRTLGWDQINDEMRISFRKTLKDKIQFSMASRSRTAGNFRGQKRKASSTIQVQGKKTPRVENITTPRSINPMLSPSMPSRNTTPHTELCLQLVPRNHAARRIVENSESTYVNPNLQYYLPANKSLIRVLHAMSTRWNVRNAFEPFIKAGQCRENSHLPRLFQVGNSTHQGWDVESAKSVTVYDLYCTLGKPTPFKLEYTWADASVLPICKDEKV